MILEHINVIILSVYYTTLTFIVLQKMGRVEFFNYCMKNKGEGRKYFQKLINGGTLFESENERQKIEPVPFPLPRASRNFPNVKTRNDFFFS